MSERTNDAVAPDLGARDLRAWGLGAWDGFPHPDPVMRHVPVSVQLPPPLWRRVLHHLSVQDAAWGAWLGECTVATLRDALERGLAHDAPRGDSPLSIPATVLEAIRATVRASFWQPLAIWFGKGDSKSDGYYRLILTNGAIAVLRPAPADPTRLVLEDLFFTQKQTTETAVESRRRQAVSQTMDRYATFDPTRGEFKPHTTRRSPHLRSIRFVEPRIWTDLPASASPAPCPTPSELAEQVGFDRLFDSGSESARPPLSSNVATLAAQELQNQLKRWTRVTTNLSVSLDDATDAYRDELCLSLLENRMSAWARFLAIDEAFATELDSDDMNPNLASEIDAVMAAMESFDEALQAAEVFWSPVASRTELLKNCEAKLAGPHRLSLPWWMHSTPSGARLRTAHYRLG
jgi:hypothetical protein